jgi:hypothetical protein
MALFITTVEQHIRNVAFINVISNLILSNVPRIMLLNKIAKFFNFVDHCYSHSKSIGQIASQFISLQPFQNTMFLQSLNRQKMN